ncbi:MAG: glycosyltransferase [Bacteroidetes bacterium]|nr:glycosyltransferase [Bacteroidota bacterium]
MFVITLIILLFSLLLLLIGFLLFFSLSRISEETLTESTLLNFSIIIAAKNEANIIQALLSSLDQLNYPQDKFEIIIVNDNSTDDTAEIISSYASKNNNLKLIRSDSSNIGKKSALTIGINNATFENLIITDADCTVQPKWLKYFSQKLNSCDIVFGVAPLNQNSGIINKIICFESLRSHLLIFGFANIGLPYSASARSFAFKKSVFNKLDGYNGTNETLSGDDDLFLREAIKHKLSIKFITTNQAFVYSEPKKSLNDYFKQKARHTSTSHHYLLRHKIILTLWHTANILCLFSFLLSFLSSIFVLPIIIKMLVDYLITNSFQEKFGYKFNTFELFVLPLTYEVFIIINFINSFRFKKRWS